MHTYIHADSDDSDDETDLNSRPGSKAVKGKAGKSVSSKDSAKKPRLIACSNFLK